MSLRLPIISKKLPQGITLKSLYQINNQSVWFLTWILKKEKFWSDLIKAVLEEPFMVRRNYYTTGQIWYLEIEKNNIIHGITCEWYSNRQLRLELHWKNGKRIGIVRCWYNNGQLLQKYGLKNEEKDGIYRAWHVNGQLKAEHHWKNGHLKGIYREWYKNGQLKLDYYWKDGKPNKMMKDI